MWLFWLIAAGIFFIGEIITVGFLIFWLGIAAIFAMIVSFITDNLVIQITVFVVSSILFILFTKPLINKYISRKEAVPTNAYRVIGQKGVVVKPINSSNDVGQVKVDGQIWSAVSDVPITKGTNVEILEIDGVKLVVTPCKVLI